MACKPDIALFELLKRFYRRWRLCNHSDGCYSVLNCGPLFHAACCPVRRNPTSDCTCGRAELQNLEMAIEKHLMEKKK